MVVLVSREESNRHTGLTIMHASLFFPLFFSRNVRGRVAPTNAPKHLRTLLAWPIPASQHVLQQGAWTRRSSELITVCAIGDATRRCRLWKINQYKHRNHGLHPTARVLETALWIYRPSARELANTLTGQQPNITPARHNFRRAGMVLMYGSFAEVVGRWNWQWRDSLFLFLCVCA